MNNDQGHSFEDGVEQGKEQLLTALEGWITEFMDEVRSWGIEHKPEKWDTIGGLKAFIEEQRTKLSTPSEDEG